MPPTKRPKPAAEPSRLRRFLLLELPGWLILAISVSYSASASGKRVVFFQVLLLSAALAWFAGGRLHNLIVGSLLFGWSLGIVAWFNLLAMASIGIYLLPLTGFLLVVLGLLQLTGSWRSRLAALAGIALGAMVEAVALGLVLRPS